MRKDRTEKYIGVHISEDVHRALAAKAAAGSRPLTAEIRIALDRHVRRRAKGLDAARERVAGWLAEAAAEG